MTVDKAGRAPTFGRMSKARTPKRPRDVSQLAGLPKQVSFEMLRWTCAVRDSRGGMSAEQLRHKLGLSKITWEETREKLARLAAPAL